ncbi:hypothetical protein CDAR_548341 [Caerostris darwini]|uniref:Uncharacterized protein n=1 Tax=Caerostris darwini TaxID=1538125 RepID=A0AAV4TLD4_9ARAC|nr:hypothetical protein CDAR_548341 [Caerostris darwini]
MSVRKFSIGDSDEDDIESEPSTTSRFGLLRIRDDIEEEENKENVEEMSTSAVMSSTSLLEENPEVESLDSGEILADIRIKPEINEDPESEEFQSVKFYFSFYFVLSVKKRTASPTFDPLLPGPSGHVQSACADILSDMKCFKRMEPIEEQKNDKREESSSEDNVPSVLPVSPIAVEELESDIIRTKKIEPVITIETERWTSSSPCSSFSSEHSSFERTESDEESLDGVESGRKHKKIKLEEIAPGYDLPGTSISSSRSCESIETDVKGLEEPKSVEKRKRKTKCTSLILPLTTISSSMQNTSEGSSVHEHKTESDEGSLEELESGRKHKKIKFDEIAPGSDLSGPSILSSSACKNVFVDLSISISML